MRREVHEKADKSTWIVRRRSRSAAALLSRLNTIVARRSCRRTARQTIRWPNQPPSLLEWSLDTSCIASRIPCHLGRLWRRPMDERQDL